MAQQAREIERNALIESVTEARLVRMGLAIDRRLDQLIDRVVEADHSLAPLRRHQLVGALILAADPDLADELVEQVRRYKNGRNWQAVVGESERGGPITLPPTRRGPRPQA
jgi:hypothetical protein